MNLKLILILLILIIAIVLFIKDYLIFKKKVLITNEETNADVKIIKNRLNLITNEIKTYNNDLITQFKKINTINSQKITSMSNYYTESETNENNHLIEYLSEHKNDLKINFKDILSDVKQNSSTMVDNKILELESDTSLDLDNNEKTEKDLENVESSSSNSSNSTNVSKSNNSNKSSKSNNSNKSSKSNKSNNSNKSSKSSKTSKSNNTAKTNPICFDENNNRDLKEVMPTVSKSDSKTTESEFIAKLQTIQPINTYSKTDLENIAKIHLIPITYQDGTQRKTYKKEELYNKIKEHFENLKLN